MNKIIRNIIFVICLILFIILLINVKNNNIDSFDIMVNDFISKYRCNTLTILSKIISFICSSYFIIGTIIILLVIKNKLWLIIGGSSLLGTIVNNLIKIIVRRPRPEYKIIEQSGFSFPSGHSSSSIMFYGIIIYLINKSNINKNIKIILNILLSLLIILIGMSRIYLGVHYASDVLAGFSLGIMLLIIFTYIIEYKKRG